MNAHHSAPFRPIGNATISGSTSSAAAALPRSRDQVGIVYNAAAAAAFVVLGQGAAPTATNAGLAVPPGGTRVIQLLEADTHIAAILASGTGNVHVAVGDGVIVS